MINRITNASIKKLEANQIFVFGSNLAGRHGKGAAETALLWGAIYGQGTGLQGSTYAIPTKDTNVYRTLSIEVIKPFVDEFIDYAKTREDLVFLVTEVGCGLAGLTPEEVAPLFINAIAIDNIHLPIRFWNVLNDIKNERTNL